MPIWKAPGLDWVKIRNNLLITNDNVKKKKKKKSLKNV